jgi:hypothetical protein
MAKHCALITMVGGERRHAYAELTDVDVAQIRLSSDVKFYDSHNPGYLDPDRRFQKYKFSDEITCNMVVEVPDLVSWHVIAQNSETFTSDVDWKNLGLWTDPIMDLKSPFSVRK